MLQTLGIWIASLVPSLVGRVLAALGLGLVTVTGLTAVTGAIEEFMYSHWAGMPSDIVQILSLAGFGGEVNIVLGAMAARVAYHVLASSSRIIGTSS